MATFSDEATAQTPVVGYLEPRLCAQGKWAPPCGEMTDDDRDRLKKMRWAVVAGLCVLCMVPGRFAAPVQIESVVVSKAYSALGTTLEIEKVTVNPLLISVQFDGMQLNTGSGEKLAMAEQRAA